MNFKFIANYGGYKAAGAKERKRRPLPLGSSDDDDDDSWEILETSLRERQVYRGCIEFFRESRATKFRACIPRLRQICKMLFPASRVFFFFPRRSARKGIRVRYGALIIDAAIIDACG